MAKQISKALDCTTSFPSGTHTLQAIVQDTDSNQSSTALEIVSVNRESYDSDLDIHQKKVTVMMTIKIHTQMLPKLVMA